MAANDAVISDNNPFQKQQPANPSGVHQPNRVAVQPKLAMKDSALVLKKEREESSKHEKVAIFECDLFGCSAAFKTKFSLQRHYKKHYTKKEIKCRFCNKSFCLPQYKEEHEYTHTGEKPFLCPTCPMRFRQRGKLCHHRKNCPNRPEAQNQAN